MRELKSSTPLRLMSKSLLGNCMLYTENTASNSNSSGSQNQLNSNKIPNNLTFFKLHWSRYRKQGGGKFQLSISMKPCSLKRLKTHVNSAIDTWILRSIKKRCISSQWQWLLPLAMNKALFISKLSQNQSILRSLLSSWLNWKLCTSRGRYLHSWITYRSILQIGL